MRRKQTALLMTLLIVGSMVFVSQIRPNSPVQSVHPGDTTGEGPPITDRDKDGMPDLHEEAFSEAIFLDQGDRSRTVQGLDSDNGTDNQSDHDFDGLTALMEYCWPYDLDSCFTDNRTGLPGKPDDISETGVRWYLDPRMGDTDGDGLPDGFEVSMCMSYTGEINAQTHVWECEIFDPLNSSDGLADSDRCELVTVFNCGDGFDVDRDGEIEPHEYYTNTEEYLYGAPESWTTEFDGLRCSGQVPHLVDPCRTDETRPTNDDGWLGTDPLDNDTDYYRWAGNPGQAFGLTQKGDGIIDGWEIYFQLDPLNSSDALIDSDVDGWDINRDGAISPDTSSVTLDLGEALSNLEEYTISVDDGNWVTAGVKSTSIGFENAVVHEYNQGTTPDILHHDTHSLFADDSVGLLYIGTRSGVSVMQPSTNSSTHYTLPAGVHLHDMYHWPSGGENGILVLTTSVGLQSIALLEDGLLSGVIDELVTGEMHLTIPLDTGSGDLDMIGFGESQNVWKYSVDSEGRIGSVESVAPLTNALQQEENATVNAAVHVVLPSDGPRLFIGTNRGLVMANSSDLSGGFPTSWIFDTSNAGQYVKSGVVGSGMDAAVQSLVVDGPRDSGGEITSPQTLWVGTRVAVHQFDLIVGPSQPVGAFSYERMYNNFDDDEATKTAGNDVLTILPLGDEVIIGSKWGTWALDADHSRSSGVEPDHTRIPGRVVDLAILTVEDEPLLFAALDPGQYANIVQIDPLSNDSDSDGMPDGWEYIFGLDPTNPFDRDDDLDADGVNLNPDADDYFDRSWTNLDEFRYVAMTDQGWNSTNPKLSDTDGDGLLDGEEYWGFFVDKTNFTCHYLNGDYLCDENTGEDARNTYITGWSDSGAGGGTDRTIDPTNTDTDGDGMPDGWEIKYRRWIGQTFTGGNEWSLDPSDPSDAVEDADGDGLTNLCEYQWQQIRLLVLEQGLSTHNETSDGAELWVDTDPNLIDSDGDGLPDGWEARYTCSWSSAQEGLNPLNGSDAGNNPDGDGYDVNHDGILQPEESLTNWMEYYLSSLIMLGDVDQNGASLAYSTHLYNDSWNGSATNAFGFFVSQEVLDDQPLAPQRDYGTSDPLSRDTDQDGMPDGWEVYFARWDVYADDWTLNPVMELDSLGDPDGDGMTNWEEYNSIAANFTESDPDKSSPQYYAFGTGNIASIQVWSEGGSSMSFGEFMTPEQIAISGMTADPNNPDTDGDGMYDGIELLFTQWNQSDMVWTLNPLVAGDGHYDADRDALTDLQELNLTVSNPINGGLSPPDAPHMWEEAILQNENAFLQRINSMLFAKGNRAMIAAQQFLDWRSNPALPSPPLLSTIIGITDPTNNDTDNDQMIDGYEYWFTEWDLDGNQWEMNPLSAADVDFDSDNDSWDCNGDGQIDENESYDNLAEYQSRIYGKYSQRFSVPANLGLMSYARDAVIAYQEEMGMSELDSRGMLYDSFVSKDIMSSERMIRINEAYSDNWNLSLVGISDPTHPDSDGDSMPDGWEFCYSVYTETLPLNSWRWSLNPINPLDVDYDPDADGWYDRTSGDVPAPQGTWESRAFTTSDSNSQIAPGNSPLYFTNILEWQMGTLPISNDTDGDAVQMVRDEANGLTVGYDKSWQLTDGREVYKFGTNPDDDDTDGDMLPDWWEHDNGWNESNDNWTSFLHIKVVWEDFGSTKKPLNVTGFDLSRPNMEWTWATFDPRDSTDATEDPDNDGGWGCSGPSCIYIPYNNFQEFFGNTTLTSAAQVRGSPLLHQGEQITEWWQLRDHLLQIGTANDIYANYFRMYRINASDDLYAHIVSDNDVDYMLLDPSDDVHICRGDWTDDWERRWGSFDRFPNTGQGEFVWGWWHLDINGDNIADGTDPLNYDTDGDWLNDWFEIDDDMVDGVRGNGGSPIRYDDRTTS